jgi:hypothetical protein
MEEGAGELVVKLAYAIHQNLQLVGRYLGLFTNLNLNVNTNVLVSEDYLRLRHALVTALHPFPEARRAVSEALHKIEAEVAAQMLARSSAAPPVLDLPAPRPRGRPPANKPQNPSQAPLGVMIDQAPTTNGSGAIRLQRPSR